MNPKLTAAQADACLDALYRGLVSIRIAGWDGDAARATAIADALHNLPHLVVGKGADTWSIEEFERLFIPELQEKYPDDAKAILAALHPPRA